MTTKGQVNIKVKVLTAPRPRRSKYGNPSSSVDVLENITFSTKVMYFPTAMVEKITPGSYCMVRNCIASDFIRVTNKSLIMTCGPFTYNADLEDEFFNPPLVTIAEAKASPQKRRLSLSGTLVSTSDLYTTESSKRKVLRIQDGGREEFAIKLWGEEAEINLPKPGSTIQISCLTTTEFNGTVEANSTSSTTITELADEINFTGTVDAINIEATEATLLLAEDDDLFHVPLHLLETIFPRLEFLPDIKVKGLRKGFKITTL